MKLYSISLYESPITGSWTIHMRRGRRHNATYKVYRYKTWRRAETVLRAARKIGFSFYDGYHGNEYHAEGRRA